MIRAHLSKEETLPRDQLDALVDFKVRAITRLAYDHNTFLHTLFRNAGINPHTDILGKSDLLLAYKKGVKTSGADIHKCYADYGSDISLLEVWTSGSTKEPKKILLSLDDIERTTRGPERFLVAAKVSNGEKILAFPAPPPHATAFTVFRQASLRNLNVRSLVFRLPTIPRNTSRSEKERIAASYIKMIGEFNPDHVRGGVFALHQFALFLTDFGLDTKKLSIKSVIFTSDPTTSEERSKIGELWNAEPFDVCASTEAATISYECTTHSGMHVNESDLLVEAVDPESSELVDEYEEGRDLCTCLYEDGELPGTFFINYSHGDRIRIIEEKLCPCGRQFKLTSYPQRDAKKKLMTGFGFDLKDERSIFHRGMRKIRRTITR